MNERKQVEKIINQPVPPKYTVSVLSVQQQKRKLLFVEDGSVDVDELKETVEGLNINIVVYRQGSEKPMLVEVE